MPEQALSIPLRSQTEIAPRRHQTARKISRETLSFYAKNGVKLINAAYEIHQEIGEVLPMITHHCIRYSLSLCPKQAKGIIGVQGQVRAEPMTLINGSEKLRLKFDCNKCEMHVMGKIKTCVLKMSPPTVVPITFHQLNLSR